MTAESLARRLAGRIRRDGPLRFDLFQEAALYDPEGGYYERAGRVGKAGDFVTGASWHPAFARCLARIAEKVRKELGSPIDVVDVGAGEGELLAGMTEALREAGNFRFIGVERSTRRRALAEARVPEARWFSFFEETPRVSGLLIAYELFDALPVRALRFDGEKLVERVVTLATGGPGRAEETRGTKDFFEWKESACMDSASILEGLRARGAALQAGQLLEVRPGARALSLSLAERVSSGLLLVFDYGAPARSLYGSARPLGTLEAFRAHSVTRDVLSDPGSRDITAWVDFTEIEEAFRTAGLTVHGLVSQSRLLSAAGIASEAVACAATAERQAVTMLFAPGGMGESIRVVVAGRATTSGEPLVRWPATENEASSSFDFG
jgi:SAM-dependent MidA family methyltransferase